MRWLLHGIMTPAVAEALRRHGHHPSVSSEAGLAADAAAGEVLRIAIAGQLDILTTDSALSAAPFDLGYPFARTIVYLQLQGADVEQDDAIDRLFARYKRLSGGRLYTVTAARVKVRQLPTKVRKIDQQLAQGES